MLDQVLAGRYRVDELLGAGGMAQVYRGTDTVLSRPVAIKVLSADYARDPAFVRRFRREAQAAARLNHPGVVAVFDTGSDGDVHFIVMELVSGRTLSDIVAAEGPLPPERAAEIGARVAEALAFAHEAGLVHRDVKPGNAMVTDRGDVKVMDFGIARAVSSQTLTQTAIVLGTAAYLSPEQARGDPVDPRSDLYSLGVVLYELLTGHPPFVASSPVAVAYKHVSEDPRPPSAVRPGIPPALEGIVLRAMAKEPARRYQSAREMQSDLEAVARGGAAVAVPVPAPDTEPLRDERTAILPPARTARPARRIGPWVVVGALVAIAVIAFLLVRAFLGSLGSPVVGPTSSSGGPTGRSTQPTTAPSSPATTTPTSSPSPAAGPSVEDAAKHVDDVLSQGVAAGFIDDKAARDIAHHVDDALREYEKDDLDKALEKLDDVNAKIDEMVSKGDITSTEFAAELKAAIQALGTAMQAQPASAADVQAPGGDGGDEGD